jgi:hypothetical protein
VKIGDKVTVATDAVKGRIHAIGECWAVIVRDEGMSNGPPMLVGVRQLKPERDKRPEPPKENPVSDDRDLAPSEANEKRRYTNAILRNGSKRPAVMILQECFNAIGYSLSVDAGYGDATEKVVEDYQSSRGIEPVDGVVGGGTWPFLVNESMKAGYRPSLLLRTMEVISWYEVSSSRDVYGMAEKDIGDGAGANYGIIQANSFGSMKTMLKMGGRDDLLAEYNSTNKSVVNSSIRSWMGSEEGVKTQNKYFKVVIFEPAKGEIKGLGPLEKWGKDKSMAAMQERLVLLMCDSRVQNGGFWSRCRPFWKTLEDEWAGTPLYRELFYGKEWDASDLGQYIKYEDLKKRWFARMEEMGEKDQHAPKTNKSIIPEMLSEIDDPEVQLSLLGQWRARTSSARYWKVVAARRMLDATGDGEVNMAKLNLWNDFGIGVL